MRFEHFLPLIENTLYFSARRCLRKFGLYGHEPEIISVDVDGTIIDSFSGYDILIKVFGFEKAWALEEEFRRRLFSGSSIERETINGIEFLYSMGVREKDLEDLLADYERENKVRKNLVDALQELKRNGKIVLVVTKGVEEFAKLIAEKYGFDDGIGTKVVDGKVVELIGTREGFVDGVPIKTKITKVKEFCEKRKIKFDRKKVCLITDDIYDVPDMRKSGKGILMVPRDPIVFQKLAILFKTYDRKIKDNYSKEQILKIIKR